MMCNFYVSNIKPFNGNNFITWKHKILILLEEHEVHEQVEKDPEPEKDRDEDWSKKNSKAKSLIVQYLADSHLFYTTGKTTTRAIWLNLVKTFERKSIVHQIYLRKKFTNVKYNDKDSLIEHLNKFDEIVQELKTGGAKFKEIDTVVVHLLVTLPQEYDNVVAALRATNASSDRQLNLEKVKEYLLDYETNKKQNEMVAGSETTKSFHTLKKKNSEKW